MLERILNHQQEQFVSDKKLKLIKFLRYLNRNDFHKSYDTDPYDQPKFCFPIENLKKDPKLKSDRKLTAGTGLDHRVEILAEIFPV